MVERKEEKKEEEGNAEDLNFYEVGFLLDPKLNEIETGQEVSKVEKVISGFGGTMVEESWPKRLKLAYPIKGNESAYFGYLLFEAPAESINGILGKLKPEKNILRFLILRRNKKYWQRTKEQAKVKAEALPTKREEHGEKIDETRLEEKLEEILK